MREYEILTPGDKIKNIRTKLGLKQEDITGGEITRNLVSIVENNKANLTEHVAKLLVNNINAICRQKDMDFTITEEYLLEDVVSQAKRIACEYIEYVENLQNIIDPDFSQMLSEIDIFLKKHNTAEKKALVYLAIGKKFKDNKNYLKAFDYYLKAFESSIDNPITLYSLEMMANCNIYLSKYEDALNYYNTLLGLATDVRLQYDTKFNIALCYKKLGKFQECINMLNIIIENCNEILSNSFEQYIKVHLLMGNCLYELKSFNKAIAIYKDLLKIVNDDFKVQELCVLLSLADVYRTTKDNVKLEKICTKIINMVDENSKILNQYEGYIYLSLADNINALNKYDEATRFLVKALEAYKLGQAAFLLEDVNKVLIGLLDIFIKNEDVNNVNYLQNELFELIERGLYPKHNEISLKLIKYYNGANHSDKINAIVDFLVG